MDSSSKMKCRKKKEQNSQDLWGNPKMCNIAQLENQKKKQQRAEKTKQTNKQKNEVIMVKKIENLTKDSNVQIQKFREHQQNKYLKNVIFKVQGKKEKILK